MTAGNLFQRIKGTQDIFPKQYYFREAAWQKIKNVFETYSYQGIEVPIIEYLDLIIKKSGEEIKKHMYAFKDLGSRDVCLRPEITPSVVRAYNLDLATEPLPLKLYYIGPTFRYDRPQEGRYRQFTHVGVEIIGADGPEYDAEVIKLACDGIEAIGITNYACIIGNINLVTQFLDNLRLDDKIKYYLIESMEELSKLKNTELALEKIKDGLKQIHIPQKEMPAKKVEKALSFIAELSKISGKPPEIFDLVEKIIAKHKSITLGPLNDLKKIVQYLTAYRIDWNRTTINFGFGRGLQYYTGMIFQLHCPNLGASNQVCGGGRYDELIQLLGGREKTRAVGFSYGLERLLLSLSKSQPSTQTEYASKLKIPHLDAMVIPIGENSYEYSIEIASKLRKHDLKVELASLGRKTRKLASRANSLKIPYVLFIGEDEKNSRTIKYKNMASGEEKTLPFDKLKNFAASVKKNK